MSILLVGDKSRFAIESYLAQPFERLSQRALGYFIVHICGRVYGVQSPEATLLACSFDAVTRRLTRRGTHIAPFATGESAQELVHAVQTALYEDTRPDVRFWGMSAEGLSDELTAQEIVLAPDGDAAFDDGSHILQFDQGDQVRLVAFQNSSDAAWNGDSLTDLTMDAAEFYRVLESWLHQFELAWHIALATRTAN